MSGTATRGKRAIQSREGVQMAMELFVTDDQSINPYLKKIINDDDRIRQIVAGERAKDHKIVVTIGSWDGVHEGQLRYLLKAAQAGDFLIVGVDSDRGLRQYKQDDWRPVRDQARRQELVAYPEFVDVVTLVDDVGEDGKWQYGLLDLVRPDVYVAVEDSYPEDQLAEIGERCGEVIVLARQGKGVSTTQEILEVVKKRLGKGFEKLFEMLERGEI